VGHLKALEAMGKIERRATDSRGIRVVVGPDYRCPVCGRKGKKDE